MKKDIERYLWARANGHFLRDLFKPVRLMTEQELEAEEMQKLRVACEVEIAFNALNQFYPRKEDK